jgi:hypothetical protein
MDPKETGCEDVDWIHLGHDRDPWLSLVTVLLQ